VRLQDAVNGDSISSSTLRPLPVYHGCRLDQHFHCWILFYALSLFANQKGAGSAGLNVLFVTWPLKCTLCRKVWAPRRRKRSTILVHGNFHLPHLTYAWKLLHYRDRFPCLPQRPTNAISVQSSFPSTTSGGETV